MSDQLTEVYASIDALVDYALDHLDSIHATQTGPATKSSPSSTWIPTRTQNHNVGGVSVRRSPRHCPAAGSQAPLTKRPPTPYSPPSAPPPQPPASSIRRKARPTPTPSWASSPPTPPISTTGSCSSSTGTAAWPPCNGSTDYCVANNYVKRAQLDRNPRFDSLRADGDHQPRQTRNSRT